jgi:NADPH-dependent glutamate synthase beta subunit-like oxidoreductase
VPTDEVMRIDCDTVILAVGERVDPDFANASGLRVNEEDGTLEVDRYSLETSRNLFYAGGDLITGASNVSNAMGIGKKAARNIDRRLMDRLTPSVLPEFIYEMEPPDPPADYARHIPAELPAAERVQNYAEVSVGLTPTAALHEAYRCLRCDIRSVES